MTVVIQEDPIRETHPELRTDEQLADYLDGMEFKYIRETLKRHRIKLHQKEKERSVEEHQYSRMAISRKMAVPLRLLVKYEEGKLLPGETRLTFIQRYARAIGLKIAVSIILIQS